MATDAKINVTVNAQKAREEIKLTNDSVEELTLNVAIQRQELAKTNQRVVEYKNALAEAGSGSEKMRFESKLIRENQLLEQQRADLKFLKDELNAARVQRKLNTKAVGAGTIKAAQFNETLLKNRDITTGLSKATGGLSLQVQSFGKLFISVGRGIQQSTASLSLFQKTLIATGIGAVVVAVGLLAANFEKVKNFITGANPELEKLEETTKKLVETSGAEITLLEKQKELLKLQNENTDEVNKLLLQKFEIQKGNLLILLDELEAQLKIEKQEAKRVTFFEKIKTGLKFFLDTEKGVEEAVKSISDENEKTLELTEKIQDTRSKILDLDIKIVKTNKEETEEKEKQAKELDKIGKLIADNIVKSVGDESKRQQAIKNVRDKFRKLNEDAEDKSAHARALRLKERGLKELEDLKATDEQKAEAIKFFNAQISQAIIDDEQSRANKIKAIEEQKIAIREKTFNTAIRLAGEESRLGKALLVAKTILAAKENIMEVKKTLIKAQQASTEATIEGAKSGSAIAQGAAETAKVGFPQNIPLIIAYAAQAIGVISAVKAAVGKTKAVAASAGASGGGGSVGINVPQIQTSAPSFNIVGAAPENQLAQTITAQQQKPVKAFVVAGDVTTAQGLERNIVQESSLG